MARQDRAARMRADTDRLRQAREAKQRAKAERTERENNNAHLGDVQRSAEQLAQDREELEFVEEQADNWEERNHKYRDLAGDAIARHLLWIHAISFSFFVDLLLLGSVGPQLAKTAKATFGAGNWLVPVGTVLLSAAFNGLELCTGFGLNGKRRGWKGTTIAVLIGLAMPLTVVAFSLLNSGLLSTDPAKIIGTATRNSLIMTSVLLGLIALAVHGFVLFFGARIMKGLGYAFYKINQVRIRRRRDRLELSISRGPGEVESTFRNFYNAYHNAGNDGGAASGPTVVPFGARTRRVVNEVFEDEVIEDPPGRDQPKPNPGQEPPTEPDPAPNAGPQPADQQQETQDEENSETEAGGAGGGYDMDGEDEIRR